MTTWHSIDQQPPKPGAYWTRKIQRIERGPHGAKITYYSQSWLNWRGGEWDGELSEWYERKEQE